jgi:hypothetical protein
MDGKQVLKVVEIILTVAFTVWYVRMRFKSNLNSSCGCGDNCSLGEDHGGIEDSTSKRSEGKD